MQYACARLLCPSQAQTGGVNALGPRAVGGTSGAVDVLVSKHFGRLVSLAAQALEWLPQPTADSSTAASAASLFESHSTSGAAWKKQDQGWATRKERNECKDTAMRRCAAVVSCNASRTALLRGVHAPPRSVAGGSLGGVAQIHDEAPALPDDAKVVRGKMQAALLE